jgi:hypothetical protein
MPGRRDCAAPQASPSRFELGGKGMAHLRSIARFGVLLASLVLALGVFGPGQTLADVHGTNLPFKGTMNGTSTVDLTTFSGGFADGHALLTGTASHFGLRTSELNVRINLPALTYTGTFLWTAANGDQLWGMVTGTGTREDATHVTWVVYHESTGGSGRFTDASATWTAIAHLTTVSNDGVTVVSDVEGTFEGQLSW